MTSRVAVPLMAPLTDDAGRPYEADVLVCRQFQPVEDGDGQRHSMWDQSAPLRERREAARLCGDCPAIQACAQRADDINPDDHGVWGGTLKAARHKRRRRQQLNNGHDPVVVRWAVAARVTLPTPKAEA